MAFLFPNYEPNSAEIISSKWRQMSEEVSKMQREHRGHRGHPPHLVTYLSFVFLWGFILTGMLHSTAG